MEYRRMEREYISYDLNPGYPHSWTGNPHSWIGNPHSWTTIITFYMLETELLTNTRATYTCRYNHNLDNNLNGTTL